MSSFWDRKIGGGDSPPPPHLQVNTWNHDAARLTAPAPFALPVTTKARSARETDRCPECNSGNYSAGIGSEVSAGSRKRCFDCGYPVQQTGSGVGGTSGGASRPAKQLDSVKHSTYSGAIIGHV